MTSFLEGAIGVFAIAQSPVVSYMDMMALSFTSSRFCLSAVADAASLAVVATQPVLLHWRPCCQLSDVWHAI